MRRTASIELHRTFFPFGPDHLAALAVTGGAAALLCAVVRRAGPVLTGGVRWGLSVALLLGAAATRYILWFEDRLTLFDLLPLQLCNFQILLAAFALVTRRALAVELLYWALSGTLLAILTPDLAYGSPDWRFISFFGLHGGVLVSALVLTCGFGLRPRAGGAWRAFGLILLYAGAAALANAALDTNYLYLRHPPDMRTPLDWLGPWPIYVVAMAALALLLFQLLELPWRRAR